MAGPTVNLTFAGDTSKLEKSFDKVGASSRTMASEVGSSSRDIGGGIDSTGQKAGDLESGFRGVTDSMGGFAKMAQGDTLGGLTDLAGGAEALATGFSGVVVPALKKTVGWLKTTRIGMAATTIATKAMAAAQRVLNLVMRMNPIGLIITAIGLLVAGLVIAWKKSETFRNIVKGAMRGVANAFGWVVDKGKGVLNWFKGMPSKIGGFLKGVGKFLLEPFRLAFNGFKTLWNNTVGGKGFTIPDWVPLIGGKSFTIPKLHQGGVVPGAPGTETMALLQAGETVTRAGATNGSVKTVKVDLGPEIMNIIRRQVRAEGGNVQIVLGV